MGISTSTLSKKELESFKKRSSNYYLEDHTPQVENLIVTPKSALTLSASAKEQSYTSPIWLETEDLDVLKRWIGVSDETVKGRNLVSSEAQKTMRNYQKTLNISDLQLKSARKAKIVSKREESIALPNTAMIDMAAAAKEKTGIRDSGTSSAIRDYAKAYLFGDSRLIREIKPLLEGHFVRFRIPVWYFLTITVRSGATLYFGPGSNIVLAHELNIESGGRVRSFGNLTVSVTNLRQS